MPLDPNLIEALTPEIPPPAAPEPPEERDPASARRWQWTQFLLGAFADQLLFAAQAVERAWHAGVGLIPWSGTDIAIHAPDLLRSAAHESGYVWGGVILTAEPGAPRLAPDNTVLSFAEGRLPIVIRHGAHEPEALEAHDPAGLLGTVASWARRRAPSSVATDGAITAAHVIGSGARSISIRDGGLFIAASGATHAPPCLDSAFLPAPWPAPSPSRYTPRAWSTVASGDATHLSGAISPAATGAVTHLSAHLRYSGSGVPRIVCHTGLGARGDSGAPVEVRGHPTAMHLGKIVLDAGGTESRGIFLEQICHVLDVELFR